MKCDHVIGYTVLDAGPARCLVCEPPTSPPARIGIRQPDGSIDTRGDLFKEQRRLNREFALRELLGAVSEVWPDGDWEPSEVSVTHSGWPAGTQRLAPLSSWKKLGEKLDLSPH